MILADKIIDLRKKAGWSQEELAEKLAVTRQSVSKWEGAQSIPDMDKVVQMSRLFGVTTDYLLKDEIEIAEPTVTEDDRRPPLRRVTIGEASDYLALRRTAAPQDGTGNDAVHFFAHCADRTGSGERAFGFSISPAGGDGSRHGAVRAVDPSRHCGGAVPGLWEQGERI